MIAKCVDMTTPRPALRTVCCSKLLTIRYIVGLGLGTHLFVKVPWPRDSERTFSVFESNCHLLLPV